MSSLPKNLEELINEASSYFDETQSTLTQLIQVEKSSDEDNGDFSDEEKILKIQLTLQYRLSCEDALSFLLKMDHNLLYFLGIQPQHSAKMNLDRLSYAIGNDDLKHILNVLAILTGSLSKIAALYRNKHISFLSKDKPYQRNYSKLKEFSKLLTKQKQLVNVLRKLDLSIHQILKLQAIGPILDHIAALRGPISQFYQASINGLDQSAQLYNLVNKKPLINYQLNDLVKEAKEVLHLMPSIYKPAPNYSLKLENPMSSEQLEQRAAAKRLRPFFG